MDDEMGLPRDEIGQTIRDQHQLNMVDCEDANENTPLSEASGNRFREYENAYAIKHPMSFC